ncbi:MerR family transcriptional regulator [Algimonas porphyrae]
MRDLEGACQLPASAIRYYVREGLLPEPVRPTANSALYSDIHLQGLRAIERIKRVAPELPLAQLKRILELVRKGVEPEVALSLHRSVGSGASSDRQYNTIEDMAAAADVAPSFIRHLMDAGILVPIFHASAPTFNDIDRQLVLTVKPFMSAVPDLIDRMAAMAALIRQVSALEMDVRDLASGGADAEQTAQISYRMQEFANLWHAYLFARFRLRDIAARGLGPAEMPHHRK